jgi:hypothetical protein
VSKCLRCGAGSEWIQGRVPDEGVPVINIIAPSLRISLEDARIIRSVFLPQNPRKMKSPHPDTLAAVCHFITALNEFASETMALTQSSDGGVE